MKVLRLMTGAAAAGGTPAALEVADIPEAAAGPGEVLVRVCSAAVTPTELSWFPTTHTPDGRLREGAVPGHEFSGIVESAGPGAEDFPAGTAVFGMNDWFADGASAEFCVARQEHLAAKPAGLPFAEAATVPISALTAWQALFGRAHVARGERVLIHGGAGAVGTFGVQLARHAGAHVVVTASRRNIDFVRDLGADEIIDYQSVPFETAAGQVDVVFDTVGGDTLARSWSLLKDPARMVTIAAEGATDARAQGAFFIVEPRRSELEQIAEMLANGTLRTFIKQAYPLDRGAEAYLSPAAGHGKSVLQIRTCA